MIQSVRLKVGIFLICLALLPQAAVAASTPHSDTVSASSASGWSDASAALVPSGHASTSSDGAVLQVSGFSTSGRGDISEVVLKADLSQVSHDDDEIRVGASATGCGSIALSSPDIEPTSTQTTYPITLSCADGWTWSRIQALQVTFESRELGGLLFSDIDGPWRVHHVRLHVDYDNEHPIAKTGADQTVDEGGAVVLDAGGSWDPEGDALSYSWSQVSGPGVSLSGGSTATPGFQAPDLATNVPKDLVFRVEVRDGYGHSDSAQTKVHVKNINKAPVADAGPDVQAKVADVVTLVGRGDDPDGDGLAHHWVQRSGPAAVLDQTDGATLSFTAPATGTLTFELEVEDPFGLSGADTVQVTVTAADVAPPDGTSGQDDGDAVDPADGPDAVDPEPTPQEPSPTDTGDDSGSDRDPEPEGPGTSNAAQVEADLILTPGRIVAAPEEEVEILARIKVGDSWITPNSCQWDSSRSGGSFTWDATTPCRGTFRAPAGTGDGFWIDVSSNLAGKTLLASASVTVAAVGELSGQEAGEIRCEAAVTGARVPVQFPGDCGIPLLIVEPAEDESALFLKTRREATWPAEPPAGAVLLSDPVHVELADASGAPAQGAFTFYLDVPNGSASCQADTCKTVLMYHDGARWRTTDLDGQEGMSLTSTVPGPGWVALASIPITPAPSSMPDWYLFAAGASGLMLIGGVSYGVARGRRHKARSKQAMDPATAEGTGATPMLHGHHDGDTPDLPQPPGRPQIVLGDLDAELRKDELIQFLNNASHDLASPLTPIRLQLTLLNNVHGKDMTEKQKHALEVVKRNVEQMGMLITDLKDASRLQAGRMDLFPEPMDLASTVKESCDSFGPPCEEKGVRLHFDHDGSEMPIEGDAGRLTQVLYNLINNALKFTDEGGTIQVALRRADDRWVCAVRDTGIGMSPEDAGKLFKPFSQAHSSAEKKKGSGLGLFICKGIVEGHGGEIWCESEGPGKGSVFAFTVPATSGPEDVGEQGTAG